MKNGMILAVFAVFLFGAAFALPLNTTTSVGATGNTTRITGPTGNATIEGGNVTEVNVSVNVSTEKWGAFYGNVTGGLVLAQSNTVRPVYKWVWDSGNGTVCASTGRNFAWSAVVATLAGDIDTAWGFLTGDIDSAANTFNETASYNFPGAGTPTGTTVGVNTLDSTDTPTWLTFAVNDGATTTKNNFAFCVDYSASNTIWEGTTGGYQVMVATNQTANQFETYYFFVQLNA